MEESTTHVFQLKDTSTTSTASLFAGGENSGDEEGKENLALRQTKFFKFTSCSFINHLYNIVIKSWADAINETAIPLVCEHLNLSDRLRGDKQKMEKLRTAFLNRLFQHGKLDLIFKQAQKFCDTYIFNIPSNAILEPEEEVSAKEIDEDMDQQWREIAELEEEILMTRIQIELVKRENKKAALIHEFLADLELDDDTQEDEDEGEEASTADDGSNEEEEEDEMEEQ